MKICKSAQMFRILVGTLLLNPMTASAADRPEPAASEFFEKKSRPLLVEQCSSCHSGKKKRGNLLLDGRENLLKGGDTGPAIVPGDPRRSLLIQAVAYKDRLRMPPRSKLSDAQIADLTT